MKMLPDNMDHPTITYFMFYTDALRYKADNIYWACNAICALRADLTYAIKEQ